MAKAATITKHEDLPDEARNGASLIKRLGFNWELDLRYPTPDAERRVQIRDESHNAPKAEVAKYAQAMAHNEALPPIVITRDGYLVDGNTRVGGAIKAKLPTLTAFILDVNYDGASAAVLRRLHLLGAAFNTRNGRGIDRAEITDAVLAVGNGTDYTAERIATLLGVSSGLVSSVLAEQRARDRAGKHGVHVNGSIPSSQLRRLGQATLNDGPFLALLQLTQDAGLTSGEVGDLVKQIKEAGNDAAALALIDQQRAERRDQIAEYRASGKSRIPHSAQLRQRLGFVLKYETTPRDLVEYSPTMVEEHRRILDRAITVLTAVRELQGKV